MIKRISHMCPHLVLAQFDDEAVPTSSSGEASSQETQTEPTVVIKEVVKEVQVAAKTPLNCAASIMLYPTESDLNSDEKLSAGIVPFVLTSEVGMNTRIGMDIDGVDSDWLQTAVNNPECIQFYGKKDTTIEDMEKYVTENGITLTIQMIFVKPYKSSGSWSYGAGRMIRDYSVTQQNDTWVTNENFAESFIAQWLTYFCNSTFTHDAAKFAYQCEDCGEYIVLHAVTFYDDKAFKYFFGENGTMPNADDDLLWE